MNVHERKKEKKRKNIRTIVGERYFNQKIERIGERHLKSQEEKHDHYENWIHLMGEYILFAHEGASCEKKPVHLLHLLLKHDPACHFMKFMMGMCKLRFTV